MPYMLSKENFAKIGEYIYRKSGIFLEEENHYEKLAKYIDERAKKIGAENFRKYFFKLRFEESGEEFQELMNAMTVNETYFYRESGQFKVLIEEVLPELHRTRPKNVPLRILSAPCSTGEEPYTMVLELVEEAKLIEERDIEIVGIDIDSTVIDKAVAARYGERSVHAVPEPVLQKCFVKKTLSYELIDDLKGTVDFQVINIFDRAKVRDLGKFDVIFSRNMLIYFDDASRKEVAMTFYEMLNPGGYVCLGHAEYMSRIVSVFKARNIGSTLIYQKQEK